MKLNLRVNIDLAKSVNYLPMGFWVKPDGSPEKPFYRITELGVPMVKVEGSTSLGYSVYVLNVDVSDAEKPSPLNSQWRKVESMELIYAQNAYIERLQAALVTAERIESMMIRTKNIEILEGALVGGTLKAVSGSFKSLNAVNGAGNVVGSIGLGDDGTFWVEGDLYHQGYDSDKSRGYRFLSSDIWCRGTLGVDAKSACKIVGGSVTYYPKGLGRPGTSYSLASATTAGGEDYYRIDLLPEQVPGMPIDLVLFEYSSNYNYVLERASKGKDVKVVNIQDNATAGFNLICNGNKIIVPGGHTLGLLYVGDLMTPFNKSHIGRGWIVTSQHDHNWT